MAPGASEAPKGSIVDTTLLELLCLAIIIIAILGAIGYYIGGTAGVVIMIAIAGIIGGGINAMTSDNGFIMPAMEPSGDQTAIIRPGFIGNILAGIVAAIVSWGLYGAFSTSCLIGCTGTQAPVSLNFAAFVGAILVGISGARWLSNEADKKMLSTAASHGLGSDKNPAAATDLAHATPAQALKIANANYHP